MDRLHNIDRKSKMYHEHLYKFNKTMQRTVLCVDHGYIYDIDCLLGSEGSCYIYLQYFFNKRQSKYDSNNECDCQNYVVVFFNYYLSIFSCFSKIRIKWLEKTWTYMDSYFLSDITFIESYL